MAQLEILVHQGCLSEQSARTLAQEMQDELQDWNIAVRHADKGDADAFGIIAFPAIVLNGRVVVTGIPRKDWLMNRLKQEMKDER